MWTMGIEDWQVISWKKIISDTDIVGKKLVVITKYEGAGLSCLTQ